MKTRSTLKSKHGDVVVTDVIREIRDPLSGEVMLQILMRRTISAGEWLTTEMAKDLIQHLSGQETKPKWLG